ncbi:MAG: ATP-binding protein [Verrucomicrobium sp.]
MGDSSQNLESIVKTNSSVEAKASSLSASSPRLLARIHGLADAVPDAILVVDAENRILATNGKFLEFFGLSPQQPCPSGLHDLRSQLEGCFNTPESFTKKWTMLNDRNAFDGQQFDEWELTRPKPRLLSLTSFPVPPESGGPILERVLVWRDRTDMRNLESALQQAQKMEAIGILAGGIAHNFNNLLTAITGNLGIALQQMQSLYSTNTGSEVISLLADAFKAAAGGRELVKQLLCHARHNSHTVQSTDIRTIVTDLRDLLKHSVSALVQVDLQLPRNLWPAMADRSDIQQVLMNLCVNAVDAMKGRANSEILITASNRARTAPPQGMSGHAAVGDYVCIEVQDNGPGIPSEVMQHLFEPFFTTKSRGEGTGLGLSSSRDIVEKLGGWIECDSQIGQGATFSVFLPKGTPPNDGGGGGQDATAQVPAPKPTGTEVILVVDDDSLVRNVSKRLLSGAGYQVFTASDGQEAVDWIKTPGNNADLVLLDVAMPRLSGPDAMVEIRKMHPGLPVVLCSGFLFDPSAFRDAHGMLPDASLYKPYEVGELTGTVRSVLDKHLGGSAPALAT